MSASLSHVLEKLERQIDSSQNLINEVKDRGLYWIQVEIITELAFLRIFIAWENFLEESFVRYSIGAESPSRYKPTRLLVPRNIGHALNLITQGREYAKWNSANEVISRVEVYFRDGEPYRNVFRGATADLNDMNTIRNRIAHKSASTKEKFNNFVRRKLGHGRRGMTPGRFLLTSMNSGSQDKYLDYYVDIIKTTACIIVP